MVLQDDLRRASLVGELKHGHGVPALIIGCPVTDAGHAVSLAPVHYIPINAGLSLLVFLIAFQFLVPSGKGAIHLARGVGELSDEYGSATFLVDFSDGFGQQFFLVERHGRGAGIVADACGLHGIAMAVHELEVGGTGSRGEYHCGDMGGEFDLGSIDACFCVGL